MTSTQDTPTPADNIPTTAAAAEDVATPATVTTPQTTDFGRMDESGNIYVIDGDTERLIGSYPDGAPEDPFALYRRRFDDIVATVDLFVDRLPTLSAKDIDSALKSIRESLVEPAALGNLAELRARVDELAERAEARKEEAREERRAAKEAALKARTELVEHAEALAAQQPENIRWKQTGQQLRDLMEQWRDMQRSGPRLDKGTEDELWKRFAAARTQFDRTRRQFFAALDKTQAEAKRVKEQIIAEAEALQDSTEWAATTSAYRALMDRWKAAPRAGRKEDDALWARFRAAQQVFFDARHAKDVATDEEYRHNLEVKEGLLAEAEALLPITDAEAAKKALRDIQDRWDDAGRVPYADVSRIEGRLRAVESALREAEEKAWRRSNPEHRARAEGMLGQLEDQIASLETQLAEAKAAGNDAKAASVEEALTTKRAWLDQIRSSME